MVHSLVPLFLFGHAQYYPRFGFETVSKYGITIGFDGIPQDVFFINIVDHSFKPWIKNELAPYRAEFGPRHDDHGCRRGLNPGEWSK